MLVKDKEFLLLIRHIPCYSYIQSSLVKVLAVIEERKHPSCYSYIQSSLVRVLAVIEERKPEDM